MLWSDGRLLSEDCLWYQIYLVPSQERLLVTLMYVLHYSGKGFMWDEMKFRKNIKNRKYFVFMNTGLKDIHASENRQHLSHETNGEALPLNFCLFQAIVDL